jgi:type IV secretory pathway VirB2 component (pilin)
MRTSTNKKIQVSIFLKKIIVILFSTLFSIAAFADTENDPFTKTGNKMETILFGSLGLSLCTIVIGVTFLMAKFGKISWDKFMYIFFCVAGFLGASTVATIIANVVGYSK